MLLLSEVMAAPLAAIFVGYDAGLLDMTVHAYSIYAVSFLFCGFSIFSSAFFTALGDGLTSALIAFLRTLVFESASVIILPLLLGSERNLGGNYRGGVYVRDGVSSLFGGEEEEVSTFLDAADL